MSFGYELVIITLMLASNAVFAAYEMALASISNAKLAFLVSQKKRGAAAAIFMKNKIEGSLAVIQLGITLFGAIAAATGGAGVRESLVPFLETSLGISGALSEVLAITMLIIPLSVVTIVLAELVPKMFGLNNKEWVCLAFSPFMRALSEMVYPVVAVFEWSVKKIVGRRPKISTLEFGDQHGLHELKAAVALARTSRLIGAHEEKIVLAAAHLSVRAVSEIMLPASDISMIHLESTLSEALIKAHLDMHTRFPVCARDGDPQTIQGYINFKDIIMAMKIKPADPTVKSIMRPIRTIHGSTPISNALEQMIHDKIHIALVASSDGHIMGLITLEDIIEELVGDIEDEFDRLPTHIHAYGPTWIMGGGVPMNLVMTTVGSEWSSGAPEARPPTLAERVAQKLGRAPQGGETFGLDGLQITVRKLRRKKLAEAIVTAAGR